MKHVFLGVALLTMVFTVGCRKKTPLELRDGTIESSYTCSNGIIDANEDGVDCGPDCTPCLLSLADCGLPLVNNQFSESFTTTVTTNFTTGQVSASTASGSLVIEGTTGGKFVRVTFSSSSPQIFSAFQANEWGTLAANEARLEYYTGTYLYTAYSGTIHLNRVNGKFSVEFCDVYMNTPSLGGYRVADGKLTQN
jgi:hypothetical protein